MYQVGGTYNNNTRFLQSPFRSSKMHPVTTPPFVVEQEWKFDSKPFKIKLGRYAHLVLKIELSGIRCSPT